jgi:two-component system response regulator ResD
VKTENPDLVLLDIIMPGTDGIDVLREVGDKMKRVIVISSVKDENLMIKVESFGVNNYIIKPFENEQVVLEVKKALEK